MKEYNEGDIILCTVRDIVKTTVFVETEDGKKGSIVFSEIAPGRIRNIRDYVVPNKIIACKILHITPDHLFLSLRRVKDKEKKELMELYKKEKSLESVIKKILGEKSSEIIKEIKSKSSLIELFENAKSNPNEFEKYFSKSEIEKLSKIQIDKKEKEKEVKEEFYLTCKEFDGIKRLKLILSSYDNIFYLGSSKFMIRIKSHNLKQAGSQMTQILEDIEKQAKKNKCEFNVKK
jgi:translation initiation factor 2 alpha subunit (eIF-2alpha)